MDNFSIKTFFVESIIITGISIVIGLTANFISSSPLPIFRTFIPPASDAKIETRQDTDFHFSEVDAILLQELVDNGQATLIDARPPLEYKASHIPGAVSLPALHFKSVYKKLSPQLSKEDIVIIYCSSRSCEDSSHVARRLFDMGYNKIMLYRGGFSDWSEKGFPVE